MYDSLHYQKVFDSVELKYFSPELYLIFALRLLKFLYSLSYLTSFILTSNLKKLVGKALYSFYLFLKIISKVEGK